MPENKKYLIVVGLAVIVVAAYFLWFRPNTPFQAPSQSNLSSIKGPGGEPYSQAFIDSLPSEAKALLVFSKAGGEEKSRLLQYADENASALRGVEVSNCIPKPLIVRAKVGGSIAIVNRSETEVNITFGGTTYKLQPQNGDALEIKKEHGAGLLNYLCSSSEGGGMGFILVEK